MAGPRVPKTNKACVPCGARKVKCDAAVTGRLPCNNCISKQCVEGCILPVRKSRIRKAIHQSPALTGQTQGSIAGQPNQLHQLDVHLPNQNITSASSDDPSPRQAEPDLLYLNILNEAVKDTPESSQYNSTCNNALQARPNDTNGSIKYPLTNLSHLDDVDRQYLAEKRVFDLPLPQHLNALVKAYFAHVHPFVPVVNRLDFVHQYLSNECSLFLLRVILTLACLHVSEDVLLACGFTSRSAAQESFFSKARLLHEFVAETDPLAMLQGSIILSMVILDHPTDRDFGYWFHNAIRLASKLDLRDACVRGDKPRNVLKLYRRVWWALCSLDVFYVSINTRRWRLLEDTPRMHSRTEDDWEEDHTSRASADLLSGLTFQQRASPIVQCQLSNIFGQCLAAVTNNHQSPQDLGHLLQPIDTWRETLAADLHVGSKTGTDIYYLNLLAISYRFECILCRLLRRRSQQSCHAARDEWPSQRLRSAILELDTIAMRVLANGTLQSFPTPFITTITALLAMHIEIALDPAESELSRTMSRISISQTMLLITQGKEIPALKRALPIFEKILVKNKLNLHAAGITGLTPSLDDSCVEPSQSQASLGTSQLDSVENSLSFDVDLVGFDFLDEWQISQMDFTDQY